MHQLSAHARDRLLNLIAAGLVVFVVCLAAQAVVYQRLLTRGLAAPEAEVRRKALIRWFGVEVAIQVGVVVAAAVYLLIMWTRHPAGYAWLVPALGAILGTALPLQLAALTIMRAAR